jgi:hypothetical protein
MVPSPFSLHSSSLYSSRKSGWGDSNDVIRAPVMQTPGWLPTVILKKPRWTCPLFPTRMTTKKENHLKYTKVSSNTHYYPNDLQ